MATRYPDLFNALAAPFDENNLRSRKVSGRDAWYITARTAMNRLDDVLGPENWWDEYTPGENSVLCRLTIRLPDGSTVTKADAGGYAGMSDEGDDDKSGYSDAFKRAAVKFGVARYLYRDGFVHFAREPEPAEAPVSGPVQGRADDAQTPPAAPAAASAPLRKTAGAGPEFLEWLRDEAPKFGADYGAVVGLLERFGKPLKYPAKVRDWTSEQATVGFREAERILEGILAEREAKSPTAAPFASAEAFRTWMRDGGRPRTAAVAAWQRETRRPVLASWDLATCVECWRAISSDEQRATA